MWIESYEKNKNYKKYGKVDDQKKYDASRPSSIIAAITQPETPPDLTAPSFKSVSLILTTT